MAKVNINSQSYEVDEEVAEQFSKFIRRAKSKDEQIKKLEQALSWAKNDWTTHRPLEQVLSTGL